MCEFCGKLFSWGFCGRSSPLSSRLLDSCRLDNGNLLENYTVHILFTRRGDLEAVKNCYQEMMAQSRLVQSTMAIPGRRSTVQQEDLRGWAMAVMKRDQEYGEAQKEVREYCSRVYSSTDQTLMETLGGSP